MWEDQKRGEETCRLLYLWVTWEILVDREGAGLRWEGGQTLSNMFVCKNRSKVSLPLLPRFSTPELAEIWLAFFTWPECGHLTLSYTVVPFCRKEGVLTVVGGGVGPQGTIYIFIGPGEAARWWLSDQMGRQELGDILVIFVFVDKCVRYHKPSPQAQYIKCDLIQVQSYRSYILIFVTRQESCIFVKFFIQGITWVLSGVPPNPSEPPRVGLKSFGLLSCPIDHSDDTSVIYLGNSKPQLSLGLS